MEPWYKIVTPRKEVREGRSFNPDEFAIALEQVVAGTAPEDYKNPARFFERTVFTRALREHSGMILRRIEREVLAKNLKGAQGLWSLPNDTLVLEAVDRAFVFRPGKNDFTPIPAGGGGWASSPIDKGGYCTAPSIWP